MSESAIGQREEEGGEHFSFFWLGYIDLWLPLFSNLSSFLIKDTWCLYFEKYSFSNSITLGRPIFFFLLLGEPYFS